MIKYSHKQTALCSYILGQIALHVYLQKVICGKLRLHSYTYGCFLISEAEVVQFLSTKTSMTCIFYSCFNFYLKKKGGGIFGDHNLPSGNQKFILDCQLVLVLKS